MFRISFTTLIYEACISGCYPRICTCTLSSYSCREKGGAYGAGVHFSDGIFSFYSFRFVHFHSVLSVTFITCIRNTCLDPLLYLHIHSNFSLTMCLATDVHFICSRESKKHERTVRRK